MKLIKNNIRYIIQLIVFVMNFGLMDEMLDIRQYESWIRVSLLILTWILSSNISEKIYDKLEHNITESFLQLEYYKDCIKDRIKR